MDRIEIHFVDGKQETFTDGQVWLKDYGVDVEDSFSTGEAATRTIPWHRIDYILKPVPQAFIA